MKKCVLIVFLGLVLFVGGANASRDIPLLITGDGTGELAGYTFSDSWSGSTGLTNGLTGSAYHFSPNIFEFNGEPRLISCDDNGVLQGYEFTQNAWIINSSISSGLYPTGWYFSSTTVFNISDTYYLISGRYLGEYYGYAWNGTGWETNSTIISGLADAGLLSSPVVFDINETKYLISGKDNGLFDGYAWNGTGWETNSTIISGLSSVGAISSASVFNYLNVTNLISGNGDGEFFGYAWNGTGWETNSTIISGLLDTGALSSPSVYIALSYTYPESPSDASVYTVDTAPYTEYVTFSWSYGLFDAKYNIQIATDPVFQSVVKDFETVSKTVSYSLYKDDYYWRVRAYGLDGQYGNWSDVYTFSVVVTPPSVPGNNIYGVVYESTDAGYQEIENAVVAISNDTYYNSLVTASTGYYFFNGLADNSTYYIVVTKDGYENSQVIPVTTGTNESINQDVILQKIEGQGKYYEQTYIRFIVTDKDLSQTYNANIKIYVGESTTAIYDRYVGSDGADSFLLDQQTRYRIETTYGGQTQTDYITPSLTEYYIFLEFITTGNTFLPATQFNRDVNITVTKNDDTGQVTVYYNDSLLQTNTLKFQIGQTAKNGTFIVIGESGVYSDTDVQSYTFTLTEYVGEDYQVRVLIDHDSFGVITRNYGVSFPGSTLPFSKGISYLCVMVLMIAGMQFGAKDANTGAVLICGLFSLMWYMDVFEAFGSGVNTLMGIGLSMAILYAILAFINDKRKEDAV